jgi:hypothetical protein
MGRRRHLPWHHHRGPQRQEQVHLQVHTSLSPPVLSLSNPYESSTLLLQVYFINAYKVFDKNPAWKINPCLIFSLLFTQYFFLKFIPNQP